MMWRDFLYFSKGERRALTLLLGLITIAFILLLLSDGHPETGKEADTNLAADTIRGSVQIEKRSEVKTTSESDEYGKKEKGTPKQKQSIFAVKDYKRSLSAHSSYPKTAKFQAGTVVELNTADSLTLKKVPGIGSAFSRRIIRYRELLGGFHSIFQLSEVYGIDAERFESLKSWFIVETAHIRQLSVNTLPTDSLSKHPYISYRQARAMHDLRTRKGKLTGWDNLSLLEEFTEEDRKRIEPYLSFE